MMLSVFEVKRNSTGECMGAHAATLDKRRDRMFYGGMAILATAIVFAGFSRTYYLRGVFGNPPIGLLRHMHGFLFTSWLVLLIVQVSLVAARRTDIHRRLGVAGGVLAALMVVAGLTLGIEAAKQGHSPPGLPPLVFLVIPVGDILVFATLVVAGFYYRRQSETHKRLMVLATLVLLPAAVARLPFAFILATGPLAFYGLPDLLLLACIGYDTLVHRRLHPAYLWGGLILIVTQPLRLLIGGTAAWLTLAHWATR
jgi:hypothetical protein